MNNAIIIGSGPGLSRSIAKKFGTNGFHITLIARNEENLKKEVELLKANAVSADYKVADVGDKNILEKTLSDIIQEQGKIPELVVLNAYAMAMKGFADESWENLKKQFDVNVGAAFNLIQFLLPKYKEQNKGKLIFTGGGMAMEPVEGVLGLSMAKAALRNMVQAAATLVKGTPIHLSTVTIKGFIGKEDPFYAPGLIAEQYWNLYNQTEAEKQVEIIY